MEKKYDYVGSVVFKKPIVGESKGKIDLFYTPNVPFSSLSIRNFGRYPLRINSAKTLLPFEVWEIGMEDLRYLELNAQISFEYMTTVTSVTNAQTGYTDAYAIEVSGIIIKQCECIKKYC